MSHQKARIYLCMYNVYKCVTGLDTRGPWLLTFVHVERYGADSDPDHALRMVEELNGLGVQGKIISVLCVGDRQRAQVSKVRQSTAALRPVLLTEKEREH